MDDSIVFAWWRQCALPCGHIGDTWRIRLNSCFLLLTQVYNPNGKSIGSEWATLSPKLSLVMGDVDPIKFMIPWARPSPQSKLHHDRFSCFRTGVRRVSLYFTMGSPFPQIALSHGGIIFKLPLLIGESGPPCSTWFPGPNRVSTQTAARSLQPFLQGSLV